LAQGLYDITPLEPLIEAGFNFLTPNVRLARRIKSEWDAKRLAAGDRVWESLSVQSLESWLLGQWDLAVSLDLVEPVTPLTSAQELELWRQLISQHELNSPDYHLLRPKAAAEQASQARNALQRWQVDTRNRAIRQLFELDRDCATFLRWLTLFEQRLAQAGQCTMVDCQARLPGLAGQLPAARLALLEFGELSPLDHATLHALGAQVLRIERPSMPGKRLSHSFSDKRAELQAVAAWAAILYRDNPATTVGIVLSEMGADRTALEYLLRREFDCLGKNYNALPVNFSTGIALAQAPLVRDAMAVLGMGLQHTTVSAVVGLLRSRFLDLPDAHSALAQRFVTQLFGAGREVLSVADLREAAVNVKLENVRGLALGRHLFTLYRMRELRRRALPTHWAARFCEVLDIWGWPGTATLDSLEFQQLELWYRTLDEFRAYDAVCAPVDFDDALQLLRECCTRQISQPQTADSAIQVLGLLEAAGLTFEHLWLCGMQSTSWPAAPRPNPFIPLRLQAQLRMPHSSSEREWEFGAALLQQYTNACQTLHASFCRQIDGVPDQPSVLLQGFAPQAVPELPPVSSQWSASWQARALEEVADHRAPPLPRVHPPALKGGSSVLEDQSSCPFRAFARHRLRAEPLGAFSIALSAADRGSLLHGALFALWGEIGNSTVLLALSDSQREDVVAMAVQAALSTLPERRRRAMGTAFWHLEAQRLASLLHEWLAVEEQRTAFSVVQREQETTLQLGQLPILLRVDRVDQLPDGSRLIIDYKSGQCTVQDWLGDRPAKPQLLLYGLTERETVSAMAFAQVRAHDCRFVGMGQVAAAAGIRVDIPRAVSPRMHAEDWAALNDRWRQILIQLAEAFVAGDASVDPLSSATCLQCGLQPLCRVDAPVEQVEETTR
jgi:ATP-dependent helicase/nuclease subunit B